MKKFLIFFIGLLTLSKIGFSLPNGCHGSYVHCSYESHPIPSEQTMGRTGRVTISYDGVSTITLDRCIALGESVTLDIPQAQFLKGKTILEKYEQCESKDQGCFDIGTAQYRVSKDGQSAIPSLFSYTLDLSKPLNCHLLPMRFHFPIQN